jgi:hypothetical protein
MSQHFVADNDIALSNGETERAPTPRPVGGDHVDAVSELARSCKAILDSYLAYDFDALYMLPIIFCKLSQTSHHSLLSTHEPNPAVRTVYAAVVLLKLYVAASTPGEMMNIIKKDELQVQDYLSRLVQHFQRIMDRDSQIPHAKFLFVLQRLNERYTSLLRQDEKRQASRRMGVPVPSRMQGPGGMPGPAQGLHLLSEVAMGGAQGVAQAQAQAAAAAQQNGTPLPGPQGQGGAPWYPPGHPMSGMQAAAVPNGVAIDPMAYGQLNGQFAGFGRFSFFSTFS